YALTVDDRTYYRKAFLISFANSSQYGNNATIAPNAKIDDGLLDVCIVRPFPNAVVPGIALRLFSNTMDQSKYIEIVRTSKIIVKNPTGAVHLDGEPTQLEPELHISNVPASLKVVVPA
ncbi:MAG: diacylglycerol kinase family lipid kinase, partial [Bacteroidota bacterium]